jgi:Flp pilus assembly protein TadD
MFRVTSLTEMSDAQLSRWIKRLALVCFVVLVAFVAFYAVDRFRMPAAPIMDRELTAMEEAVRADPADVSARGRLADAYFIAGRYDEAITQYSEVIRTGEKDEAAYVSRGVAYERKGDLDAAAADYAKVVEIAKDTELANVDPMLQTAYYGLGSIALAQDRADEAIEPLNKALLIKRTDADTLNLLGAAYVRAGQPAKAFEPLRKAILFVPAGWAEPYQSLADAYAATGETEQAEWAGAMAAAMTALTQQPPGDTSAAMARLEAISVGAAGLDARIGLGLLAKGDGEKKAVASGTEGHPVVMPSPSAEGSN